MMVSLTYTYLRRKTIFSASPGLMIVLVKALSAPPPAHSLPHTVEHSSTV